MANSKYWRPKYKILSGLSPLSSKKVCTFLVTQGPTPTLPPPPPPPPSYGSELLTRFLILNNSVLALFNFPDIIYMRFRWKMSIIFNSKIFNISWEKSLFPFRFKDYRIIFFYIREISIVLSHYTRFFKVKIDKFIKFFNRSA